MSTFYRISKINQGKKSSGLLGVNGKNHAENTMLKKRNFFSGRELSGDNLVFKTLERQCQRAVDAKRNAILSTDLSNIPGSKLKGLHENGFDLKGAMFDNDAGKFKAFIDESLL